MRVALVCPYSWNVPGGVQSHVAGLAGALQARGVAAEILAPADRRVSFPGFVPLGRSVPILDNGSIVRVALDPASSARIARLVRSGRYDIVHLHEPMIPAVCLTALLASTRPLVGTFHMYASSRRWYRPFAPLARAAIPRLDARIAVSEAALLHVTRTCPGEYRIIPNGIDVASFSAPGERAGGRILFIGRADPRKGLAVLLEAFSRLPGTTELELVGVSPRELSRAGRRLPPPAARRVSALGHVSDTERAALLARADVLCAPSLEGESFGIVLVEGMAAGVPVVASAIPGYVDVLPESCGRLVPPGQPEALADALRLLLADGTLRARLGEAGRRAARRFDWQRVCTEVLEVYEEVLGGREAARSSRPRRGKVERAATAGTVGSTNPQKRYTRTPRSAGASGTPTATRAAVIAASTPPRPPAGNGSAIDTYPVA
jgi:phosphatidylinositol alpha-mannosyltransferase